MLLCLSLQAGGCVRALELGLGEDEHFGTEAPDSGNGADAGDTGDTDDIDTTWDASTGDGGAR